jgi:glucan 1,3-beta-glucosidase
MRVSTLLPLALAAGTAAASKNGTLGFALGNKNEGGKCKVQSDYETDFDTLKEVTSLVRIYSASDCDTAKHIIPAAKAKNFKVVLGVWYGTRHITSALRQAARLLTLPRLVGPITTNLSPTTSTP